MRVGLVASASYTTHLLLDALILDNSAPIGMPLLWPLSAEHLALPLHLFENVLHDTSVFNLHNVGVAVTGLRWR